MTNRSIILLVVAAVAIFLLTQTFYSVDPTKQVLVRQFGAIVGEPKTQPGLYAKVQRSMNTDCSAFIPIVDLPRLYASGPDVVGFSPNSQGKYSFENVSKK